MTEFAQVESVGALLSDLRCDWQVCGGWAIDLYLGRVTRAHKDIDVSIARRCQLEVRDYLLRRGWRLEKALDGKLTPWADGEFLSEPFHAVWCWNEAHDPGFVELMLDDIDDETFRFRRDHSVTMSRERMSFETQAGLPVLAPEIVLLYKSNEVEGYAEDFRNAVGALDAEARAWLKDALEKVYAHHTWAEEL